jgi:hypothetical protein
LPLICPACRKRSERGVELATLEVESRSRTEGEGGISALARGAEVVVGVDKSPWALRLARRLLRGEEVRYWRSGITGEEERLGGADPAAALRTEAAQLGWTIVEDDDQSF